MVTLYLQISQANWHIKLRSSQISRDILSFPPLFHQNLRRPVTVYPLQFSKTFGQVLDRLETGKRYRRYQQGLYFVSDGKWWWQLYEEDGFYAATFSAGLLAEVGCDRRLSTAGEGAGWGIWVGLLSKRSDGDEKANDFARGVSVYKGCELDYI
jgi:hypothetical protein